MPTTAMMLKKKSKPSNADMRPLIDLQIAVEDQDIPASENFELWVTNTLKKTGVGRDAELAIRIVTAEEIQQLNLQFRRKDKATNVLSFPFDLPVGIPEEEAVNYLGDLAICAEVVQTESKQQDKPLINHWAHMVIHGTLHLLGYDHIDDQDAEIMEDLERQVLQELSIPDPY